MRQISVSEAAIEYVNAYNSHDRKRLRAGYADDFVVTNPLWEGTKGPEETTDTIEAVWNALTGARFHLNNLIVSGETAILEMLFEWDDPRDQQTKRFAVVDIFTVEDGKLASLRAYHDTSNMSRWLEEMGAELNL